jgi:hypothetical protein
MNAFHFEGPSARPSQAGPIPTGGPMSYRAGEGLS